MSKTKFIVSNSDVEHFLKNLILDRELFTAANEIDIWKSAFIDLYGIEEVLIHEINAWKKSENFAEIGGNALEELHKITNQFLKKVQKEGTASGGTWCGADSECTKLVIDYIKETKPLFLNILEKVHSSGELKQEIQTLLEKLPV